MSRVEKVSVALTPDVAAELREAVARGEYASTSEVMRDALRHWRRRRLEQEQAVARLGELWDEGLASGPARDGEQAIARIRSRFGRAAG